MGAIFKPPIGCVPLPVGAGLGAGAVHVSKQMAADYGIEGRRLLQAYQEPFANWMTTQPSSQNNQAASLKRNRRQSAGFASALCRLALFAGIPAAFWLHDDAEP
jgi:hypothetical protein